MAWTVTVDVTSTRLSFIPDDGTHPTEREARQHAIDIVKRGTFVGGAEPDKYMGPHRVTHVTVAEV